MKDETKQLKMSFEWKKELVNLFFLVSGALIAAASVNLFYVPLRMTMGGFSGIALIIFNLTGQGNFLSLGVLTLMLNIPIFIWGWRAFGFKMVYRSLIGTFVFSFFVDLTENTFVGLFQKIVDSAEHRPDAIIFALFGGITFGFGLGLILRGHYTTGGSDILAFIAVRKIHGMTIGTFIFVFDVVVVAAAVLTQAIAGNVDLLTPMYAFIALYLTGKTTDLVLIGADSSVAFYIISDHSETIARQILNRMDRGVTALNGRGMYTGNRKDILFVVLSHREVPDLKKIVVAEDETAFLIVVNAQEVAGEGFAKTDFM